MDIILKDVLDRMADNVGKNEVTLDRMGVNVGKNIETLGENKEAIGQLKKFYRSHKKGILIVGTLGVAAIVIGAYTLAKSFNTAQKLQDHMDVVEGKDVTNATDDLYDLISDAENNSAEYTNFAHFGMTAKDYSAELNQSFGLNVIGCKEVIDRYNNITRVLDNLTATNILLETTIDSNLDKLQGYLDQDVGDLTEYDIAAVENHAKNLTRLAAEIPKISETDYANSMANAQTIKSDLDERVQDASNLPDLPEGYSSHDSYIQDTMAHLENSIEQLSKHNNGNISRATIDLMGFLNKTLESYENILKQVEERGYNGVDHYAAARDAQIQKLDIDVYKGTGVVDLSEKQLSIDDALEAKDGTVSAWDNVEKSFSMGPTAFRNFYQGNGSIQKIFLDTADLDEETVDIWTNEDSDGERESNNIDFTRNNGRTAYKVIFSFEDGRETLIEFKNLDAGGDVFGAAETHIVSNAMNAIKKATFMDINPFNHKNSRLYHEVTAAVEG